MQLDAAPALVAALSADALCDAFTPGAAGEMQLSSGTAPDTAGQPVPFECPGAAPPPIPPMRMGGAAALGSSEERCSLRWLFVLILILACIAVALLLCCGAHAYVSTTGSVEPRRRRRSSSSTDDDQEEAMAAVVQREQRSRSEKTLQRARSARGATTGDGGDGFDGVDGETPSMPPRPHSVPTRGEAVRSERRWGSEETEEASWSSSAGSRSERQMVAHRALHSAPPSAGRRGRIDPISEHLHRAAEELAAIEVLDSGSRKDLKVVTKRTSGVSCHGAAAGTDDGGGGNGRRAGNKKPTGKPLRAKGAPLTRSSISEIDVTTTTITSASASRQISASMKEQQRSLQGRPLALAAGSHCCVALLLIIIVLLAALGVAWPDSACR